MALLQSQGSCRIKLENNKEWSASKNLEGKGRTILQDTLWVFPLEAGKHHGQQVTIS